MSPGPAARVTKVDRPAADSATKGSPRARSTQSKGWSTAQLSVNVETQLPAIEFGSPTFAPPAVEVQSLQDKVGAGCQPVK